MFSSLFVCLCAFIFLFVSNFAQKNFDRICIISRATFKSILLSTPQVSPGMCEWRDGSGSGWLGVVVARTAGLNWKLSNSSLTIAGLWRYGDWRHVATGCTALLPGEPKKISPTTFVDITAMHGNFCTKFYTIVKRSNIHFITKFYWNISGIDKATQF